MPVLKESRNLRYPMQAQIRGQEGQVRMRLFISATGTVDRARIVHSSGFSILDEAALQYASQLQFEPATRNGTPERSLIAWRVRFKISDTSREAMAFVTDVSRLYVEGQEQPGTVPVLAPRILDAHETFAATSTDAITINDYIRLVILPETYADYAAIWGSCPLRFTLFDDYLRRFPGIESERASELLLQFAREDALYASGLCLTSTSSQARIDSVIQGMRTILHARYPALDVIPKSQIMP